MTKKETIRTIVILSLISMCIYGLQILIFHDLRDTEFYILQDLAFIPISIAITTVVTGNIIDARDKREAREKSGMLRSAFFTEIGNDLLKILLSISSKDSIVHAEEESYEAIRQLLTEKKQTLITLTGNSSLMEQADFTQMLGGIFHLLDEFHLRGSWKDLSESDRSHMDDDFSKVLVLLKSNWEENMRFQQKYFPDFYQTFNKTIRAHQKSEAD